MALTPLQDTKLRNCELLTNVEQCKAFLPLSKRAANMAWNRRCRKKARSVIMQRTVFLGVYTIYLESDVFCANTSAAVSVISHSSLTILLANLWAKIDFYSFKTWRNKWASNKGQTFWKIHTLICQPNQFCVQIHPDITDQVVANSYAFFVIPFMRLMMWCFAHDAWLARGPSTVVITTYFLELPLRTWVNTFVHYGFLSLVHLHLEGIQDDWKAFQQPFRAISSQWLAQIRPAFLKGRLNCQIHTFVTATVL